MKRWRALQRYVESGHLAIENKPIENAIRPIVIGKKNWLFSGSEHAGRRAAAIQTLFATAKLNGLDPARWLAETLDALPTCQNSVSSGCKLIHQSEAIAAFCRAALIPNEA